LRLCSVAQFLRQRKQQAGSAVSEKPAVVYLPEGRAQGRARARASAGVRFNFADLRVPGVSVADEAFVVRRCRVWGDIKRLVKELKVGDVMTDVHLLAHHLRLRLPPDDKTRPVRE
jgi:hypothetical protein